MKLRLSPYCPNKPTVKQMAFLAYDGLEAFYGGAAAGGKSDALLQAALQYTDVPEYAAMLFRRTYADLALPGALMDRAHQWLKPHKDVRWDRDTHTFIFPSGAKLSFGYIASPNDKWRYQSSELQFIGWDEVTDFPDDDAYLFMFSRLRRLEGSPIPLRVRSASNPVGVGAYWVKERFVEDGPNRKGVFFPANFYDNKHVDEKAYLRSLQELPESTQKRLIDGSWEEIENAAYPEFNEDIHVVPPFQVPYEYRRWEAMDFGVTNPTAWLASALSPQGHTLVYDEYYSPGLINEHASAILTRRSFAWGEPIIAVCDPSIKARTGFGITGAGDTVHSEFQKNGLYLVPANNDRRAGRIRISQLLKPDPGLVYPDWHEKAGQLGSPRIFFTTQCRETIKQLKLAPIDAKEGDIVDPFWESRRGHAVAALRYLTTARIYPREQLQEFGVGGRVLTRQWARFPESEPYG